VTELFSFPNPVNEKAARVVAAGVVVLSLLALLPGLTWLTLPIAVGFGLRVASGPRFSPLGLLATKLVAPRLGAPKPVPGPPKRFAQAIGAVLSTAAALAYFGFAATGLAQVLLGLILCAATLESVFAICLGCLLFARLMRAGVISPAVCRACHDVSLRYSQNG
jgi:multisubunit Na+/H+ antiporter MnhG subunit